MCAADPCSQLSPVNLVMLTNTARAGVLAMGKMSFESSAFGNEYVGMRREFIIKKFADEIYWSFG